jgi:[ribosomal protein S5]-alanine N-acetyltransferase
VSVDLSAPSLPLRQAVAIRHLAPADEEEYLERTRTSRDFHERWVKSPITSDEFRRYLARFEQSDDECFVICDEGQSIVGFATMSDRKGEPFLSAALGYGTFLGFTGRGYMAAGLELVIRYAFGDLGLHRLQADIQPENLASLNLVKRLGFEFEGCAKANIRILGQWRDHERWALVSQER